MRHRVTDVEDMLMVTMGGEGGRVNWEIGIDICALKYIAGKNLLSNTGSSTQQSEMTYTGRESKKDMSITLSVCCTTKTNATF